jgi:hypothetical protein
MSATTSRNIDAICRELEQLTHDLRHLETTEAPSKATLRASPLLDQWSYGFIPVPCLVGTLYDHPMLGNRPCVHTSELVVIDQRKRWARTWSRFYRLGHQMRTDESPAQES